MEKSTVPPVVGVGASAGGLEALEEFFQEMPIDCGLAFVVIQHLSPDYKSLMVELLSKKTKLSVQRAEDGVPVQPGCIYLIPPKKNMTIFHGALILEEQKKTGPINLPIDIFFQSLAVDQGERAVGIVLSGTGSDGTRGVRRIKEMGGMIMVQDEESAQFDGMPRAAKSTGTADYILPPRKMASPLINYTRHPRESREERAAALLEDNTTMNRLFAELRARTQVDFSFYKPSTLVRRIERRMMICQISTVEDYLKHLYRNPGETVTLSKELLIGVTSFFRDPAVMKSLREDYLPPLLQKIQDREIRFWIAGCSSGEEAYSLAIMIRETMEALGIMRDIKIFATDLDSDAIAKAGRGLYPESIAADLSPALLSKYFYQQDHNYLITRNIREMVVFARHNVVKDPPFTNIDLISCRNLLIYMQPVLQQKALEFFHFSLNTGGILLLGTSETIGGLTSLYEPLHQKHKIYHALGGSQRMPRPPLGGAAQEDASRKDASREKPPGAEKTKTEGLAFPLYPKERKGYAGYQGSRETAEGQLMARFLDTAGQSYLPLSIIVNQEMEILHIIGDSQGYLKVPSGKAVYDISRMASRDLAIPLSTGIQKVFRTGEEMAYKNIMLTGLKEADGVHMRIAPLPGKKTQEPLVAVFLEEFRKEARPVRGEQKTDNTEEMVGEIYDAREEAQQRIADLEQDLQFSKENLQATIEELETANEELQATNEELLASNEELQSTNEELQSTNEELYTVNTEHQQKITELTELNNDVYNLLSASHIGKLLLDENLEIRKYSPEITKIFRIMESDIGRPLDHLNHRILEFDIHRAVAEVSRSNREQEHHIQIEGGIWYLLRIFPYHIAPQVFSGVVLSFVDITRMKEAEREGAEYKQTTEDIITNMPAGLFVYRAQGEGEEMQFFLEQSNPEAERLTGISASEKRGISFQELWKGTAAEGLRELLKTVMQKNTVMRREEVSYQDNQVKGTFRITAFPLAGEKLAVSFEMVPSGGQQTSGGE